MTKPLTQLAVLLCVVMQAWFGCTYRSGLVLCVPTGHLEHDGESASSCERPCSHHASDEDRAPRPAPSHDHDSSCCVDFFMPDSTVPSARLVVDGPVSSWAMAPVFAAILPGSEFGTAPVCCVDRARPPDGISRRASSGVGTTRLRI